MDDRPRYMISVAADLVGMHPQTLRIYERRGLVSPARTQGGNRRYSDDDIELLRRISELTDAAEQRRRFAHDGDEKARLYGERYPIDEDFLAALEHGLPESAGMALGFDRLVMCASGAARIEDVLWAPVDER